MLVELTDRRLDYVHALLDQAGLWWATAPWADQARRLPRGKCIAVMPADAWLLVRSLIHRDVISARGGWVPKTPRYKIATLSAVAAACGTRSRHPAIAGRAVAGLAFEVVPAWKTVADGMTPFGAFAGDDSEFTVLVPSWTPGDLTVWHEDLLPREPHPLLFEEEAHLAFCVEVHPDRGEH